MYDDESEKGDAAAFAFPDPVVHRHSAGIYAASVKLPDFWQQNPRAWFQHIEAQFQLRGITQDVTR